MFQPEHEHIPGRCPKEPNDHLHHTRLQELHAIDWDKSPKGIYAAGQLRDELILRFKKTQLYQMYEFNEDGLRERYAELLETVEPSESTGTCMTCQEWVLCYAAAPFLVVQTIEGLVNEFDFDEAAREAFLKPMLGAQRTAFNIALHCRELVGVEEP